MEKGLPFSESSSFMCHPDKRGQNESSQVLEYHGQGFMRFNTLSRSIAIRTYASCIVGALSNSLSFLPQCDFQSVGCLTSNVVSPQIRFPIILPVREISRRWSGLVESDWQKSQVDSPQEAWLVETYIRCLHTIHPIVSFGALVKW